MIKVLACTVVASLLGFASVAQAQSAKNPSERETKAEYHLSFADSLETAGAFQGASLVYKMVVELYPNSVYYAEAVRSLGHLYINPFNTARNDSIALYWFKKHLEIPWLQRGERSRSVIVSSLVRERLKSNTTDSRRADVIDSLSQLARIQAAEIAAQSKRIAELRSDLEQTDTDLHILLEFQKNPIVTRRDSLAASSTTLQRLAEATDSQQERKNVEQSNEQLRKLREIDLRALQRRSKR